jgi:hypothetical protein
MLKVVVVAACTRIPYALVVLVAACTINLNYLVLLQFYTRTIFFITKIASVVPLDNNSLVAGYPPTLYLVGMHQQL